MKREYYVILDDIISQLKSFKEAVTTDKATKEIAYPTIEKYQILEVEFDVMWQQLKDDKIIICPDNNDKWKLSLKGWSFSYQNEIASKNAENIRVGKIEKTQKEFRKFQNILTILIAIGTLIAAWYYGIEIWKYYNH